jgi:hypothetical protein
LAVTYSCEEETRVTEEGLLRLVAEDACLVEEYRKTKDERRVAEETRKDKEARKVREKAKCFHTAEDDEHAEPDTATRRRHPNITRLPVQDESGVAADLRINREFLNRHCWKQQQE